MASLEHLLPVLSSLPLAIDTPGLRTLLTNVTLCTSRDTRARILDDFVHALERLIADLRASENSSVFHKPVRKQDAPDYYLVIKAPMDFQTLTKKVRAKTYTTKVGFKRDLERIWSNCYTYNTDPAHPLRRFAAALQTKANLLLAAIPDPNQVKSAALEALGSELDSALGERGIAGLDQGTAEEVPMEAQPPADAQTTGFGSLPAIVRAHQAMETSIVDPFRLSSEQSLQLPTAADVCNGLPLPFFGESER